MKTCSATEKTSSGGACQNPTAEGSDLCRMHAKEQYAKKIEAEFIVNRDAAIKEIVARLDKAGMKSSVTDHGWGGNARYIALEDGSDVKLEILGTTSRFGWSATTSGVVLELSRRSDRDLGFIAVSRKYTSAEKLVAAGLALAKKVTDRKKAREENRKQAETARAKEARVERAAKAEVEALGVKVVNDVLFTEPCITYGANDEPVHTGEYTIHIRSFPVFKAGSPAAAAEIIRAINAIVEKYEVKS